MSELRTVPGFEDVWRPPVGLQRRRPETVLKPGSDGSNTRARLARLVARTPEVMVKVTGRTRDGGHLRAHLEYISRNGELEVEDRDGNQLTGRGDIRDLAEDWTAMAATDSRRRANSPLSLSIVLSMPAQTDPLALRDAARAFASEAFGDGFDYAFVLHTDAGHPHVHLAVRALGDEGQRLNPKRADLEAWRQVFARSLREHGVAAEATPRRARGVTRKAEKTPVRKLRERHERGGGPVARVYGAALREAAAAAFGGDTAPRPWETAISRRQAKVRALYLAQARILLASPDDVDRALGRALETFVQAMPAPDTQRLALARELRAANERWLNSSDQRPRESPDRSRSR
jgi:type IV secretory pathway VirD2 relaxase